jgi:uncharacterized protein (TIGR00725 family)
MYYIGVIGGNSVSKKLYDTAYKAGQEIAKRGGIVVCGGLSGVMEAACKGAREQGGLTIGILPGRDKSTANEFTGVRIACGMGEARNIVIANTADGFVAIDGEYGTLSEIAFALKLGKPVVGMKTYDIKGIVAVNNPVEAVERIFKMVKEKNEKTY